MEGRLEACSIGLGGNTWKDPSKELGMASTWGPSVAGLWMGPGQIAGLATGLRSRSQVGSKLGNPDQAV